MDWKCQSTILKCDVYSIALTFKVVNKLFSIKVAKQPGLNIGDIQNLNYDLTKEPSKVMMDRIRKIFLW